MSDLCVTCKEEVADVDMEYCGACHVPAHDDDFDNDCLGRHLLVCEELQERERLEAKRDNARLATWTETAEQWVP